MKTMKNISPSYQSHYHNNHQSSKMKVKAVYKTSKSKALGEDESPMQLIRYAPKSTKDEIGQICNKRIFGNFERNKHRKIWYAAYSETKKRRKTPKGGHV